MAIMTIREAAEALGVSVDTIRRRVKEGKFEAKKVKGKYGEQWIINSDSLVEYQQAIEVVPIKTNIDPGQLMDSIREAAQEAARLGTLQAMQENNEELESLRNEVKALRELIEQQLEDKEVVTLGQRIKGIFKRDK